MSDTKRIIPLSVPNISGNEWKYVKDCLDTGWISSVGAYVSEFENKVADYVGAKYGVAVVNGTNAIHVALQLSGVQQGDYVIMPNITFVATANAIKYANAEPILIDANPDTWQMDLDLLENFLKENTMLSERGLIYKKDGRRIKAILPVHVQGNIGDMPRLMNIAQEFELEVVEDSAEALGTRLNGKHAGTFARMGCFSFNGNKIISTGGGGLIVTDDEELAKRIKHLTTTAKTDPMQYFHDEVGYNYRMVNVLAAMGVAQMEKLDDFVKRKNQINDFYKSRLSGVGDIRFQKTLDGVEHNNWLFTIQTNHQSLLLKELNANGVICRPFWMPMNKLPMYKDCLYVNNSDQCDYIHKTCLSIPCSTGITDEELDIVASNIEKIVPQDVSIV